ncbi:5'-AMP-activated protein kinase catalytic subunit alpha-1 [Papilio machaon]|uniref:non-specific serine/threonine protein kinase n=1 Tax=Papilio machaon TaxID=76193 RepID=A0A0N1PJ69_PAPMA|nr:5'-AMP-activated protein kinase catalytic subunit alpha-1 [Papilio machaon]
MKRQLSSLPALVDDIRLIKDELSVLKIACDFSHAKVEEFNARLMDVESKVSQIDNTDLSTLHAELAKAKQDLSAQEQRSRLNNVEIKGIPLKKGENLFSESGFVDVEAIAEVCEKFGVKEQEVHTALLSGNQHDQLAIAYHLIIDNKRIADEAAKAEIKDFYIAGHSPPNTAEPTRPHPERIAPMRSKESPSALPAQDKQRGTPVKRAKWHLGIRSQSKPNDIMLEVFRAMKALDYEWKVINPYHVRVRTLNKKTDKFVKMSLQLYQVDYKSYLLDFKSLSSEKEEYDEDSASTSVASTPPNPMTIPTAPQGHHTMEFFEMCAALIIQLAR